MTWVRSSPHLITAMLAASSSMMMAEAKYIVGGEPAADGEYPAYAHSGGDYLCGGILVHEDIVLTAAHCGTDVWPNGGTVYIGANQQDGSDATTTTTVESSMLHPDYNSDFDLYDAMLLKLTDSSAVTPATYADADGSDDPSAGDSVTVCGFGDTQFGGSTSDVLMDVSVDVYSIDECATTYECIFDDITLCAGTMAGGKDSCQGDSGGPLFSNGVVVGVVSYGNGCGDADVPGVYAKVSGFSDWIAEGICSMSDNAPGSCTSRRRAAANVPDAQDTKMNAELPHGHAAMTDRSLIDASLFFGLCFNFDSCPRDS